MRDTLLRRPWTRYCATKLWVARVLAEGGRFCREAARLGVCRVRRILGGRGGGERSLIAAREHQGRSDRERHARGSCAVSVERLCQGIQDSHLLVDRRGGITTSTSRWCWRV